MEQALSRWLTEPKSGVFLGNPSARIRDELWNMARAQLSGGSAIQVWSSRCPQGFKFRSCGSPKRELVDLEGIAVVRLPNPKNKKEQEKLNTPSDVKEKKASNVSPS